MDSLKTIFSHLPGSIRAPLERAAPLYSSDAHEIILRADRPLTIECAKQRYYLTQSGVLTTCGQGNGLLKTAFGELVSVFRSICDYSVYARQNELNHGYITVGSGVRIGVCGTAVSNDCGVTNIRDITTLSFRIAREIIGFGDAILSQLDPTDGVLIFGPPCCGKTTVIRDLARTLSYRCKVSVIDERNELSATCGGVSGCDIGMSDVLIGMRKREGIIHAVRSLSPDVIVCDEAGERSDADALVSALRCGAAFIATVHARDFDDLQSRTLTRSLLDTGAFRFLVMLADRTRAGEVKAIYERRRGCETAVVYDRHRRVAGCGADAVVAAERKDKDPERLYHAS